MAVIDWILLLLLGGLAGALGQGARVIVGLKKVNDQAAALNGTPRELIQVSRLLLSLLIGFVAGALAAVAMGMKASATISSEQVLGLLAAGYTGADFIEGLMNRSLPTVPPAATPAQAPSGEGR